jgi:hypothetical protein
MLLLLHVAGTCRLCHADCCSTSRPKTSEGRKGTKAYCVCVTNAAKREGVLSYYVDSEPYVTRIRMLFNNKVLQ